MQGLTAQSTMEAGFVAVALAIKEAVFCSNMMQELGFGTRFDCVPLYIHRQHLDSARSWKPDLQLASQTSGCAMLFHPGASQGEKNIH